MKIIKAEYVTYDLWGTIPAAVAPHTGLRLHLEDGTFREFNLDRLNNMIFHILVGRSGDKIKYEGRNAKEVFLIADGIEKLTYDLVLTELNRKFVGKDYALGKRDCWTVVIYFSEHFLGIPKIVLPGPLGHLDLVFTSGTPVNANTARELVHIAGETYKIYEMITGQTFMKKAAKKMFKKGAGLLKESLEILAAKRKTVEVEEEKERSREHQLSCQQDKIIADALRLMKEKSILVEILIQTASRLKSTKEKYDSAIKNIKKIRSEVINLFVSGSVLSTAVAASNKHKSDIGQIIKEVDIHQNHLKLLETHISAADQKIKDLENDREACKTEIKEKQKMIEQFKQQETEINNQLSALEQEDSEQIIPGTAAGMR